MSAPNTMRVEWNGKTLELAGSGRGRHRAFRAQVAECGELELKPQSDGWVATFWLAMGRISGTYATSAEGAIASLEHEIREARTLLNRGCR